MRDEWKSEVDAVLTLARVEMEGELGSAVKLSHEGTHEVIIPKFTVKSRLGDHLKGRESIVEVAGRAQKANQVVRNVWLKHRDAHSRLWRFQDWYADRMRDGNTADLSDKSFAEHMRMKRDAQATETDS